MSYAPKLQSRRLGLRDFQNVAYRSDGKEGGTEGSDGDTGIVLKAITDLGTSNKTLIDQVKTDLSADITEAKAAGQAAQAKIEALEASIGTKALATQATEVKSFLTIVHEALEEKKADLELTSTQKNHSTQLNLKAANSLMTTTYVGNSTGLIPAPTVLNGGAPFIAPQPNINILQLVDTGVSDTPSVQWVNELPVEGDAAWTPEGGLKAQVAWKYNNETATSRNVTAFVKVTTQALRNISWLANRINTRLREIILKKVNVGVLTGDGTGNSPEGITPNVPGFTITQFNGTVQSPNDMDALMVLAGQVEQAEFEPNIALMNGVDIRKMKLQKATDGQYVLPPFVTANGTYIDNMRVIKNNTIPAGFALVGDFSKFTVLIVDNLKVDIGLDGDDFTHNRRTILAEMEILTMINTSELPAFVYASLATVKTAIAKPATP